MDLTEVSKLLDHLHDELKGKITASATKAAANVVAKHARKIARRQLRGSEYSTGLLASKIKVSKVKPRKTTNDISALIYPANEPGHQPNRPGRVNPRFYTHLVEYGTRYIRARAFLRPALDIARDEAEQAFIKAAQKGVDKLIDKAHLRETDRLRLPSTSQATLRF